VTSDYFSKAPATVVGCDEPGFPPKITTHEYSRIKTTTCHNIFEDRSGWNLSKALSTILNVTVGVSN